MEWTASICKRHAEFVIVVDGSWGRILSCGLAQHFFSYGLVSCGFRPSACNCSSHLCDCQTASCWDQRCPVRDMAAVLFLRDNGSGPLIRNFVPGYILDLGSSGFISLNTELWCPRPRLWGFLSFESANQIYPCLSEDCILKHVRNLLWFSACARCCFCLDCLRGFPPCLISSHFFERPVWFEAIGGALRCPTGCNRSRWSLRLVIPWPQMPVDFDKMGEFYSFI